MSVSRLVALPAALLLIAVHSSAQQPGGTAAPATTAQEDAVPQAGTGGDVERGRYLVEQVAMCAECHSTRDTLGNIDPRMRFMGGPMPVRPAWEIDWPLYIPRIAGLPGYDDEQALRLLTQGAIKRDGTQLRLPMPRFRMTPEDAAAVVAFLRSF